MEETIVCPGCQAQLTLPTLPAGQTVQCPRCQRVFEPAQRSVSRPKASLPVRRDIEHDDQETVERLGRIVPRETLIGPWFGYFTMATIAAFALAFAARAYAEYEVAEQVARQVRGELRRPLGRRPDRFLSEVEFWQGATGLAALPSFAIWLFLASRNARRLHASDISLTPSTVLLVLCCPILNLILAYINLQELWRASDPRQIETLVSWRNAPPGALIRLWGLNMLCIPLLAFCSGLNGGAAGVIAANLSVAASGGLTIAIIYYIQVRQQQRYIRLYEDPD